MTDVIEGSMQTTAGSELRKERRTRKPRLAALTLAALACVVSTALACGLVGCAGAGTGTQDGGSGVASGGSGDAAGSGEDAGAQGATTYGNTVEEGQPAPEFVCADASADGQGAGEVSLSQYQGRVVVVTSWASWCRYCVEDMPVWDQLKQEFGEDLVVIAVNVGDDQATAQQFAADHDYGFVWAMTSADFDSKYFSQGIPYDVVIGPDGVVVPEVEGSLGDGMYDSYRQVISGLLE